MNLVVLAGRLTADPELKITDDKIPYCRATLAVDKEYKTADGKRQADFIDFVCWRKTAEFLTKYFSKGSMVIVQGKLEVQKYQKDGNKRINYCVRAEKIGFGGDYKKAAVNQAIDEPSVTYDSSYPDFMRGDFDEIT